MNLRPFVLLAAMAGTALVAAQPLPLLREGMPARGIIGGGPPLPTAVGGTPATFRIDVPANTAAHVRLRHQGIYLTLRLEENGKRVTISDDSNGENGEELIAVPIRDTDASYEVYVVPVPKGVCGSYELTLEHVPLDENARTFAEAHRVYYEARRLEVAGDSKSLNTALERFAEAAALAQKAGQLITEAEIRYRAAIVYGQMSRIAEGIEQTNLVIPLAQMLGFRGAEGRALDRRGELARRVGDVVAAERDLEAALPLALEAMDYEGFCDIRNNLGLVYQQSGRWDEAIALYEDALPYADKVSPDLASALEANLGLTYSDMGDYARALPPLERSLAIKRQGKLPRRISQTLHGIALTQIAMGETAKAAVTLKETLELAEVAGDPQAIGNVHATLGRLHLRAHEREAAEQSFAKALEMLRSARDRRAEARVLVSLARARIENGQPDAAMELLDQALAATREIRDRTNECATLHLRAKVLQNAGRLSEALADAEAAVAVVESIREAIVNPDLRSTYLSTVRSYFDLVIELQMLEHERDPSGGFAAAAFRTNERARARTLLESLARSQANIEKGIAPELLEKERDIQRQLNAKESYRVQLLRGDPKAPQLATTDRAIAELAAAHRAVKAEIRASSPDYADLEFPEAVTLGQVRAQLLDADTTLLEYHLGNERSFLWIVSAAGVDVRVLPGEREIETLVKAWHDSLRRNPSTLDAAAAEQLRKRTKNAGDALARAVLRPAAGLVQGKRLLIVPDGALYYVPFAALPDAQGKPLIASHEITSLPSATLLATLRRAPRTDESIGRIAVFADPVFQRNDSRFGGSAAPSAKSTERDVKLDSEERTGSFGELRRLRFSRKEAEAILSTADRKTSLEALDFRATKQALLETDLRRYGILHIATHGLANSEEPDLSGLMFSRYDKHGKRIDGFLRLHDVYNLDLQAELVVLSACRTALGKAVFGEGLISLTRGFMYGGAKRVMATVWSVDDRAAAHLMAQVYDAMQQRSATPARALREAQTAMARDPRWNDPYYWAAFTIQGDWQ